MDNNPVFAARALNDSIARFNYYYAAYLQEWAVFGPNGNAILYQNLSGALATALNVFASTALSDAAIRRLLPEVPKLVRNFIDTEDGLNIPLLNKLLSTLSKNKLWMLFTKTTEDEATLAWMCAYHHASEWLVGDPAWACARDHILQEWTGLARRETTPEQRFAETVTHLYGPVCWALYQQTRDTTSKFNTKAQIGEAAQATVAAIWHAGIPLTCGTAPAINISAATLPDFNQTL